MDFQINQIITENELRKFEFIRIFLDYKLYVLNEDYTYIIAIDKSSLICGCFEFHETDEGFQLAHMHVVGSLKGQGIGSEIMKEAVDMWEIFDLPSTDRSRTYHYIENGLRFIHHCFDIGILTEPTFTRPEEYVIS